MSFSDWFRRIFASSSAKTDAGAPGAPGSMPGAPGVSRLADIETAQAVEDIDASTEAPSDSAQ